MNSLDCVNKISEAYNDLAYRTTKAILTPVMGAVFDTVSETLSSAIRAGVKDAFTPTDSWTLPFFSWKK